MSGKRKDKENSAAEAVDQEPNEAEKAFGLFRKATVEDDPEASTDDTGKKA